MPKLCHSPSVSTRFNRQHSGNGTTDTEQRIDLTKFFFSQPNGIVEVVGSIPSGSTIKTLAETRGFCFDLIERPILTERQTFALFDVMQALSFLPRLELATSGEPKLLHIAFCK